MIPVHQTVFDDEYGNCLQAAVASVLELPLEAVPNFMEYSDEDWIARLDEFLAGHGLYHYAFRYDEELKPKGYSLICGLSPRFDKNIYHAIVAYDGTPVHDPHPEGYCQLRTRELYYLFVARLDGRFPHVARGQNV